MIHGFAMLSEVDEAPPDAPTGPPTTVIGYVFGASQYGVQWTNADPLAYVQVAYSATLRVQPTSGSDIIGLPQGTTNYETGDTFNEETYDTYGSWWVRHITGGGASAWVEWEFIDI